MNKQEYKQAKEIIDNAPEGATHCETLASSNVYYLKRFNQYGVYGYKLFSSDHKAWVDNGCSTGKVRQLSDIKTMVKQYEIIEKLTCLLNDVKGDLLSRAEIDSDGCKVVDLGATNWSRLKELTE